MRQTAGPVARPCRAAPRGTMLAPSPKRDRMARQILLRQQCPRSLPSPRPVTGRIGLALLMALGLQACGDSTSDYPQLAPTEALLRGPDIPAHAAAAATSGEGVKSQLEARRGSLQAQGARPSPAPDTSDLAARARALRSRADALRRADPAGAPTASPDAAQSSGNREGQTSECLDNNGDCTPASNQ